MIAKKMVKKFLQIKTLPHIAFQLTQMISEDNSTMQEFESVIKLDPTLVLKTLKLVNSPYYALRKKVTSISEAVVYIGMENLRNIIVVSAIKDIYSKECKSDSFSRAKLWLHCAAVGLCNQMVSERIMGEKGEDPFLCGILHDIGMIIEDQVVPDDFLEICDEFKKSKTLITDIEKEHLGSNHCEIGSILAEHWKLSEDIQNGIKNHHEIENTLAPNNITSITQIGEYLVSRMGYSSLNGMKGTLPAPLSEHMKQYIGEYKMIAMDLPDELNKAKEIYKINI
ncbi:MAG: HDOD domain-containing protein [Desulfobacterales bacterium]|nr:HDOD domain-containing protein [Desulfobacterales bacterium]MCP4161940.1 HDOD domain-containing protein [Deltaproteobacteria bacterium]